MALENSLIPRLTREEIARIFGPNPRAVRAYEALQNGLSIEVINAINAAQSAADAAQDSADEARIDADSARRDANEGASLAARLSNALDLMESAPVTSPHSQSQEDPHARIESLEAIVYGLISEIESLKQGTLV